MSVEYNSGFNDKYDLGDLLGSGNFADVVEGTPKLKKRSSFAVKVVYKCNLENDKDESALESEIDILNSVDHDSIVKLHNVFAENDAYYLVTEHLKGGTLVERMEEMEYYTEPEAHGLVRNLLEAVAYLHKNDIAHRDLKPANIVFVGYEDDIDVKLIDFGFAKRVTSNSCLRTQCGTLEYSAPEVLSGKLYGTKADVWSLGVIVYYVLCGYEAFEVGTTKRRRENIIGGFYKFHDEYWAEISKAAKGFVRSLLNIRPGKRLSARKALEHAWIAEETHANSSKENLQDSFENEFTEPDNRKKAPETLVNSSESRVAVIIDETLNESKRAEHKRLFDEIDDNTEDVEPKRKFDITRIDSDRNLSAKITQVEEERKEKKSPEEALQGEQCNNSNTKNLLKENIHISSKENLLEENNQKLSKDDTRKENSHKPSKDNLQREIGNSSKSDKFDIFRIESWKNVVGDEEIKPDKKSHSLGGNARWDEEKQKEDNTVKQLDEERNNIFDMFRIDSWKNLVDCTNNIEEKNFGDKQNIKENREEKFNFLNIGSWKQIMNTKLSNESIRKQ